MAVNGHKILDYLYLGREKLAQAILSLTSFMFVRIYLLFLLALNIINWLLAFYVNNNVSQNLVVLHYNINLGVNLIGEAKDIYIIPAIGLVFIAVNFLLLLNIFRKDKFLTHLLLGSSLLTNLFLIISTAAIYLVNFR